MSKPATTLRVRSAILSQAQLNNLQEGFSRDPMRVCLSNDTIRFEFSHFVKRGKPTQNSETWVGSKIVRFRSADEARAVYRDLQRSRGDRYSFPD